ncbi:hypothetical protein FACS1894110_11450 [Spirochaetia bacterium]|nr:hypothetical protein FACS1894110_11450 [Spirochaetia bacterium]
MQPNPKGEVPLLNMQPNPKGEALLSAGDNSAGTDGNSPTGSYLLDLFENPIGSLTSRFSGFVR